MRDARRCVPIAFLLLLLLGLGIGSSQISANFSLLGEATVYTKAPNVLFAAVTNYINYPKGLLLAANADRGALWGHCAGALMDVYHIYSTTVGMAVSTVTFSTQKYAFGCAQLEAVTVATTSTVTQATTTTETRIVTTGTTVTTETTVTQTQTVTDTTTLTATQTVTTGTTVVTTETTTQMATRTTTLSTTQTVTTATTATATATETRTVVSSTTTVLQVQVQEGVYWLIAMLFGSLTPLLAGSAMKAQRVYRARRALRAAEGSSGGLMQGLDTESYRKKRRALR